jgi:hypothetical protein
VTLCYINLMTMDYGDDAASHPAGRMSAHAIDAARAAVRQTVRLYRHMSAAARKRHIGLTPMIGLRVTTETSASTTPRSSRATRAPTVSA